MGGEQFPGPKKAVALLLQSSLGIGGLSKMAGAPTFKTTCHLAILQDGRAREIPQDGNPPAIYSNSNNNNNLERENSQDGKSDAHQGSAPSLAEVRAFCALTAAAPGNATARLAMEFGGALTGGESAPGRKKIGRQHTCRKRSGCLCLYEHESSRI